MSSLPLTICLCIVAAALGLFVAFLVFCFAFVLWNALRASLGAEETPKQDEDGLPLPPLGRRI